MKKYIFLWAISLLIGLFAEKSYSQNSQNGYWLPTTGTLRVFLVFAEVVNDPALSNPNSDFYTPDVNWPQGQMPLNPNAYFDPAYDANNLQGFMTKYFSQASFGQLKIIGDYYPSLIQVDYNSIPQNQNGESNIVSYLNSQPGTDVITANGYSINSSDFDVWTNPTGFGQAKVLASDNYIDAMLVCWRVNSKVSTRNNSGNCDNGSTTSALKSKLGFMMKGRFVSLGSDAFIIMRHEFSHDLYGPNNFHTGGAGHGTRHFISDVGGYSNMSSWDLSSPGWNAWDRRRMGWKGTTNANLISARNTAATEVNADFTYGQSFPNNINEFILRDFVNSGDAIRIKLPYLKSESSSIYDQYLWIENHQILAGNIDNPSGTTKGIYSYLQIGKENMTTFSEDGNYTYPVVGFGNYDYSYGAIGSKSAYDLNIYNILFDEVDPYNTFKSTPKLIANSDKTNPFTGYHHLMLNAYNLVDPNGSYYDQIRSNEILLAEGLEKDGTMLPSNAYNYYTYPYAGTIYDAFTAGMKIGIGYNPAPTPVYTYQTADNSTSQPHSTPQSYDNRKIFLNGVSVEVMEAYGNGDIRVKVRWDDFDVPNNVRWCGDIVLNEQVHLLASKTITLDQGLTPQKPINPITFNGTKVFADPTVFTCKNGSSVLMESNSNYIVDNGSTLTLQSGSSFEVKNGATLRVRSSSQLTLEQGSTIIVDDGGQIIIEGTGKLAYQGGTITLNGANAKLEIAGILDIAASANFTFAGGGYVKFSSTVTNADNIMAGSGSSMTFTGTNMLTNKVLEIAQDQLWLPTSLSLFKVQTGKIVFSHYSGKIKQNTSHGTPAAIELHNVKFTNDQTGRTNYIGLYLLKASNVILDNCLFEKGTNGIYAYLIGTGNELGTSTTPITGSFTNCYSGINIYGTAIHVKATFSDSYNGLYATGMSAASDLSSCAFNTNTYAVRYFGGSSATLNIDGNLMSGNTNGVSLDGSFTANVRCSQINGSAGSYGIKALNGCVVDLSGTINGHNDLSNNLYPIWYSSAGTPILSSGYNKFIHGSGGLDFFGTLNTTPPYVLAPYNEWKSPNGSPISGTDYSSTLPNVYDFYYAPYNATGCGGGQGLMAIQPTNQLTTDVSTITTTSFSNVSLSTAVTSATTDLASGNTISAISKLHEILNTNIKAPKANDEYWLDMAYNYLNTASGIAVKNNQITASGHLNKMLAINDKQITKYQSNYQKHLHRSLDKAHTYRLFGRQDLAVNIINNILTWVSPDDLDYINQWYCINKTESDYNAGLITLDEADAIYQSGSCTPGISGSNAKSLNTANGNDATTQETLSSKIVDNISIENSISINPNPVTGNSIIEASVANKAANSELSIVSAQGITVKSYKLNKGITNIKISNNDLANGTYWLILQVDGVVSDKKQIVIVK